MKRVIAIAILLSVLRAGAHDGHTDLLWHYHGTTGVVGTTMEALVTTGICERVVVSISHSCTDELTKLLPPGYKLDVNKQYVKVYYANTNEPYRAWTIYYSHGETYDAEGDWISLYHEPKISYLDMRVYNTKTNLSFKTNPTENSVDAKFKDGFAAGVKWGILSFMENPQEENVNFHICEAQKWYWLIVVDKGNTLMEMAENND